MLNGHRHWYERLAPVTPAGVIDPATGIREFVVGTGGEDHQGDSTRGPLSELYDNATFGVIKVALHPTGYDWQFVPESGETFTDSGTGSCHGPSADTAAPAVPTGLSATASTGPNKVDLSWSPSTDDTAVEGYRIFRNGAPVGYTTIGTAWTDTRAAAGVTYSYTVQAYDTTGNQSGPSDPAVATIPGGSTVITIPAAADGRVLSGQPNRSYGTVSPLIVDGTPKLRSFLRFDTSGLAGRTVVSAKLRLWCTNGSPSGGTVYGTDGASSNRDRAYLEHHARPGLPGGQPRHGDRVVEPAGRRHPAGHRPRHRRPRDRQHQRRRRGVPLAGDHERQPSPGPRGHGPLTGYYDQRARLGQGGSSVQPTTVNA